MKLIRIIQDVSIPGMPGFRKGQQVRVKDSLADLLCDRGHAKEEKGKSEEEVKKEQPKKRTVESPAKVETKGESIETSVSKSGDVSVTSVRGKTK